MTSQSTTVTARIAARKAASSGPVWGPPHEQHGSDDGTRAGQQRSTQWHERHVGPGPFGLGRLLQLTGEQLQRDQQQQ